MINKKAKEKKMITAEEAKEIADGIEVCSNKFEYYKRLIEQEIQDAANKGKYECTVVIYTAQNAYTLAEEICDTLLKNDYTVGLGRISSTRCILQINW
jgi:hypothetical protein